MKKKFSFSIIITQDEDGMYLAKVPELQGCHAQARNLSTLYKRVEEVVSLCLEVQNLTYIN